MRRTTPPALHAWDVINDFFAWRQDVRQSTPYEVWFQPNVAEMLIAIGLSTEDEWQARMQQPANPDPRSGNFLARNGVKAVVGERERCVDLRRR